MIPDDEEEAQLDSETVTRRVMTMMRRYDVDKIVANTIFCYWLILIVVRQRYNLFRRSQMQDTHIESFSASLFFGYL